MSNNPQAKKKRKVNKTNIFALIVSIIVALAFIAMIVGVIIVATMLQDKPTLNLGDFEQAESSIIYDRNGTEVANLGSVIRQNVEYNELPNCVVDAFVAVEDSRFFVHNGFDIHAMTRAAIYDVLKGEIVSGASTFTMQLVKNTYFTNGDTGEEAVREGISGIRRKIQEIALAIELEKYEPKQFIFESYLNKLNYGGENNIRGIQKAAQYYFNKNVTDLNLNEAAFLAGVINAPYYYSPFTQDSDNTYHIEQAQEREEEVLYQMYRHGYISQAEYELAKSVKVVDLLQKPHSSRDSKNGIPYQAYVDAVVSEVIDLTGLDPYTTTMHIYTYLNKDIQEVMDNIQSQGKDDYLAYSDDFVECASVCIDNATGQVVGILGGRNYSNGGQLLLNHATEQKKQPGSSIKPILDYALAFENLGWATDHVLHDVPMYMDSSKMNLVYNFSNTYVGDVTLKQAVGESINTCAIQTLQSVLDKMKYEYVVNYCKSMGYDFSLDNFNVQYAIGGSTCEVTPYQHAAAYAAIMNYGVYNTPHTISRIEFTNGKSPITPVYESKQVLSEQASYLTTELMKSNVDSYGGSYDVVKNDTYQVYAKTGTTDWAADDGKPYGIPGGANKDAWLIASTSEYTTATWVGYEKAVLGQPSYITNEFYYSRPQAKIAHLILDACYQYGDDKPSVIAKPSGITSVTHIIGTWPYANTKIDGVSVKEELITTGLAKADSVKLVNLTAPSIDVKPEGCKATVSGEYSFSAILSLNWQTYPDQEALKEIEDSKDTSLKTASGEVIVPATGKVLFDYSWIFGPIVYKADVTVKTDDEVREYSVSSKGDDRQTLSIGDIRRGADIQIAFYYQYENMPNIKSKSEIVSIKNDLIIMLPSNMSKEKMEEWCIDNGVAFKTEVNEAKANTYIVTTGNRTYTEGETIYGASSSITCTYYVKQKTSLAIINTGTNKYSFILSNDEPHSIKWSSTGISILETSEDDMSVIIDPKDGGTLKLTVTTESGEILTTQEDIIVD